MKSTSLTISKTSGTVKFVSPEGEVSDTRHPEVPLLVDRYDPFRQVPVLHTRAAEVTLLTAGAELSPGVINEMKCGSAQQYRAKINLTDSRSLRVGLWLEYRHGAPKRHQFLVGGEQLAIEFPLTNDLVPLDMMPENFAELLVLARQRTSAIKFKSGSHVTDWAPIQHMFSDSLDVPGMAIDWSKIDPVWVRWALKAAPQSNIETTASLVLEALPCGKTDMSNLSRESKSVIKGGAVKTFFLWSMDAAWVSPMPGCFLPMTPGIHLKSTDDPPVTDPMIRWFIANALEMSRRGCYYEASQCNWWDYLAKPTKEPAPLAVPMAFVLGEPAGDEGKLTIFRGKFEL